MVDYPQFQGWMFASAPNYHLECKIYPWDTYLMAITYGESILDLGEFLN